MIRYITRQFKGASFILDKHTWNARFFEGELSSTAIKCLEDINYEIENYYYDGFAEEDRELITKNFLEIKQSLKDFLLIEDTKKSHNEDLSIKDSFSNAFDQLFAYARDNCQVTNLNIELTSRCNLNCNFCYVENHIEPGISIDLIKDFALEIQKAGVVFVLLTGGEVFIRKDIFEIIEIFNELGFAIEIKTNGLLLGIEDIKRLANYNIFDLQISIYEVENKQSKLCNSYYDFSKIEYNIRELIRYNVPFTLSVLVGKHNIDNIREIHKKLMSIGDVKIFYSPYITPNRKNINRTKKYRLSSKELTSKYLPFIDEINALPDIKKYRSTKSNDLVCYAGRDQIAIYSDGTATPCLDLNIKLGNIYVDSFQYILDSVTSKMAGFSIKKIPACQACNIKDFCDSCIGVAITENNDYRIPLKHKCDVSKFYYENNMHKVE